MPIKSGVTREHFFLNTENHKTTIWGLFFYDMDWTQNIRHFLTSKRPKSFWEIECRSVPSQKQRESPQRSSLFKLNYMYSRSQSCAQRESSARAAAARCCHSRGWMTHPQHAHSIWVLAMTRIPHFLFSSPGKRGLRICLFLASSFTVEGHFFCVHPVVHHIY